MNAKEIVLVYDRECPVCTMYSRMLQIRQSLGDLQLVNARDQHDILEAINARGWDIDQGMVLKLDDELYYGADAIHALSLISSRSGVFNRINYWIFKSPLLSRVLYPVLRTSRNLLLKILGRSKINNLGIPGNDHF